MIKASADDVKVSCSEGRIVAQRRGKAKKEDFGRGWQDYKKGFGNAQGTNCILQGIT